MNPKQPLNNNETKRQDSGYFINIISREVAAQRGRVCGKIGRSTAGVLVVVWAGWWEGGGRGGGEGAGEATMSVTVNLGWEYSGGSEHSTVGC